MIMTGWIISALVALFLLGASAAPKFMRADVAIDSLEALGWSPDYLILIGVMELVFTILYVIPRTSVVGAVLLTGLLGGALASNLRADMPLFSHTLFGIYLGAFVWAGLLLRDTELQAYFKP